MSSSGGSELGSDVWIEGDDNQAECYGEGVVLLNRGDGNLEEGGGDGEVRERSITSAIAGAAAGRRGIAGISGGPVVDNRWPWDAPSSLDADCESEISWPSDEGGEGGSVVVLEEEDGSSVAGLRGNGTGNDGGLQELLDHIPAPESELAAGSSKGGGDGSSSPSPSRIAGSTATAIHPGPSHQPTHFTRGHDPSNMGDKGTAALPHSRGINEVTRVEQLEALMRAKDRVLGERQATIEGVAAELEAAVRHGHAIASERDEWRGAFEQLRAENSRLSEGLEQAGVTIEALRNQGEDVQQQLSLAHVSIEELHERIKGLQNGDDIMNAAKYEHHLQELEHRWHSDMQRAAEEGDALRRQAADLQEEIEILTAKHQAQQEAGTAAEQQATRREMCDFGMQARPEDDDGQKGGLAAGGESSRVEALRSQVRALECELQAARLASASGGGAAAAEAIGVGGEAEVKGGGGVSFGRLQREVLELRRLNGELIKANEGMMESNGRLMREAGRGIEERQRVAIDEAERRRWAEAKESEIRKVLAEAGKRSEAAVKSAVEEGQRLLAAREKQLLANKEAETKRLRAAWNKNRDESIKAVEQRCAKELASALDRQRSELGKAPATLSNAATQVKEEDVDVRGSAGGHPLALSLSEVSAHFISSSSLPSAAQASKGSADNIMPSAACSKGVQTKGGEMGGGERRLDDEVMQAAIDAETARLKADTEAVLHGVRKMLLLERREAVAKLEAEVGRETVPAAAASLSSSSRGRDDAGDGQGKYSMREADEARSVASELKQRLEEAEASLRDALCERDALSASLGAAEASLKESRLESVGLRGSLEAAVKIGEAKAQGIEGAHSALYRDEQLQHEALSAEIERLRGEVDEHTASLSAVAGERDELSRLLSASRHETESLAESIEGAVKDRDAAREERDVTVQERDEAIQERDAAVKDRDAAREEIDAAVKVRDAAMRERDNAVKERDEASELLSRARHSLSEADLLLAASRNDVGEAKGQVGKEDEKGGAEDAGKEAKTRASAHRMETPASRRQAREREAAAQRESDEALEKLRKRLAEDRRAASARAIDNAIRAAVCVREHTQRILAEELAKEVAAVKGTHARRREKVLSACEEELRAALEAELGALRKQEAERAAKERDALEREHSRDMSVLKREFEVRVEREFAVMQEKADAEIAAEHQRVRVSVDAARADAQSKGNEEREGIAREAAAEVKRAAEEARESVERAREGCIKDAMMMLEGARRELERLAKEGMVPIAREFGESVEGAVAGMREGWEVEAAMELGDGDGSVRERLSAAVMELRKRVGMEGSKVVKEAVKKCKAERAARVAEAVTRAEEERRRRIEEAGVEREEELEMLVKDEAARLEKELEDELAQVREEEEKKTASEVEMAREKAREEGRDAERKAMEELEEGGKAAARAIKEGAALRMDAELGELREALARKRDEEVERVVEEEREAGRRAVEMVRKQLEEERERRLAAAAKSNEGQRERMQLEVRRRHEEEIERCIKDAKEAERKRCEEELGAMRARREEEIKSEIARVVAEEEKEREEEREEEERRAREEKRERLRLVERQAREWQREKEREMEREMEVEEAEGLKAAREKARREGREALVKREREGKEREEREEAELRGRLEEERRAVLEKVKRELLARRNAAIKRVAAECDEAVAAELDRQDRELTKSRLRRLEATREEHQSNVEEEVAHVSMRSGMELAREISTLRDECAAECDAIVNSMSRPSSSYDAPREAKEGESDLVGGLRAEWRLMLASLKRGGPATATSATSSTTPCTRCDELRSEVERLRGEGAEQMDPESDRRHAKKPASGGEMLPTAAVGAKWMANDAVGGDDDHVHDDHDDESGAAVMHMGRRPSSASLFRDEDVLLTDDSSSSSSPSLCGDAQGADGDVNVGDVGDEEEERAVARFRELHRRAGKGGAAAEAGGELVDDLTSMLLCLCPSPPQKKPAFKPPADNSPSVAAAMSSNPTPARASTTPTKSRHTLPTPSKPPRDARRTDQAKTALSAFESPKKALGGAPERRGVSSKDEVATAYNTPLARRSQESSSSRGSSASKSPFKERDRLLLSLLRRSGTRRSLSSLFNATQ